jgi:ferredoxin
MEKPHMGKLAQVGRECVACGCCVRVCPREAIRIYRGLRALVNAEKCIGCGRCVAACPASVISLGPAAMRPLSAPAGGCHGKTALV